MKSVLIIEDSEQMLRIYNKALCYMEDFKTRVHMVRSAEKAILKLIRGFRYDLYVIDYMLPEISGLDLITYIMKMTEDGAQFLIISARSKDEIQQEALKKGLNGGVNILEKPIKLDDLRDIIRREFKKAGIKCK